MKIIDCFSFYNELDLLKYRINILKDVVDYVVIVESTHTHVGNEKILYFDKFKKEFPLYDNSRIIHVIVDDFPHKAPDIQPSPTFSGHQWVNERFQRNCIIRGIEQIPHIENDDIIIVTDLDEIPDPRTLQKIKNGEIDVTINHMEMTLYYYNLNTFHRDYWINGFLCEYGIFLNNSTTLSDIRLSKLNTPNIKNGGWHLSYFGDISFIQNKLREFAHVEFSGDKYTDENFIKNKMTNALSLFDINNESGIIKQSIKDDKYPPLYYKTFLSKYVYF
jgi:beta-1,4-mannosyl-glycoprotein beta-1,4-N-acetylglucosaminyltransferase